MSSTPLGDALRAWRARLSPADVGLPAGGDRRVPGLRREEVAWLAGVSVDYLVRLEQGRRGVQPAPPTVAALARALRLTDAERDLLHRLAGGLPPAAGSVPTHVPPGLQRTVDRLADNAVAVFSASWTILQWNRLWAALQGDPSTVSGRERNLAWRHFTGAPSRALRTPAEHDAHSREMVADLRAATARYPADGELAGLVRDLRRIDAFEELWARFETAPRHTGLKTVLHPEVGPVTLDCQILTAEPADLRVVVLTAEPGSPAESAMALLGAIGTQSFST